MKTLPYTEDAYRLLHEGAITLGLVEHNGIKIDTRYLDKTLQETGNTIREKQETLSESDVMKAWKDRYRSKTNFDSAQQLGKVLFEVMGFKSPGRTSGGQNYKTDEEALTTVKHPFVKDYLEIKKLQKGVQFLEGIRAEVCEGFLHPSFNLHIVKTYRSSSDSPNFQNLPVRNANLKKMVRRCIVARKGRRIIEIDYGGIEVKVSACYHEDPTMIRYIEDKTTDMHRDMAMECYLLPQEEVTKDIRYCAKNKFVFPQFYGSWWFDCSRNLWRAIGQMELKTTSGIPLRDHLRKKGIKKLGEQNRDNARPVPGSYEEHIQKVERRFWDKRFPVYTRWKKRWYTDYQQQGWFATKTGFVCQGYMSRNDAINYPVQGSAFHCLLWSLIELQKEITKRRMKTLIVGQIHDSIIADVPENEVEEFLRLVREIMIDRLMAEWEWINVPLEIEAEMSPVGGSWVDKEKVEIPT